MCLSGLGTWKEGRPSREQKEADRLFLQSCEGGIAFACNALATRYESRGEGMTHVGKVIELYEKACKGSDADGCRNSMGYQNQPNSSQ